MSKSYVPGANRTAQYWAGKYRGSSMNTNCVCLHTTEGFSWPGYGGGASAPHLTILPNIAAKTVSMRQHFPADRSSRALVNKTGGVETNTLNVFQIELIGTCDSRNAKTWLGRTAGVDYIYWPDAPQWLLEAIAPVFRWMDKEWPDFKVVDATPRGWVRYPDSYGINARQRMSFAEWRGAYGIFGHQHVPENTHGDPGNFPIKRLLAAIEGTSTPEPAPTPVDHRMNPRAYHEGAVGPHVTWLGERLVAHGYTGYSFGPGPEWGPKDREGVRLFQEAQGWTGSDADGYPGPETLRRLAATPRPKPVGTTVTTYVHNLAGNNRYGIRTASTRIPKVIGAIRGIRPDVALVQETTVASRIRPMLDKGLTWMTRRGGGWGRYAYLDNGVKFIKGGVITVKKNHWYQRDDKQAAWVIFEKDGIRGMDVGTHLESALGSAADQKRVDQMRDVIRQSCSIATTNNVLWRNLLIAGDLNSEKMVIDDIEEIKWLNVGAGTAYENAPTFIRWDGRGTQRFDYGVVHASCLSARLTGVLRNADRSDHAALVIRRTLT